MSDYKLIQADARALPLANESVDCVITSPPYWGLRDYGEDVAMWWDGNGDCKHNPIRIKGTRNIGRDDGYYGGKTGFGEMDIKQKQPRDSNFCTKCGAWYGQLGLEPTIELYLKHIGECLKEIYRVLKKTGTFWFNVGDTYGGSRESRSNAGVRKKMIDGLSFQNPQANARPKSLCLIPDRIRIMMVEMGWIIRNKNVWHKKNAMPSSVKDRFSNSYEDVIFATKTSDPQFWWNEKTGEAVWKRLNRDKRGIDHYWRWHKACKGLGEIFNEKEKKWEKCKSPRCKNGQEKVSYWHGEDVCFDLDAVRERHKSDSGWSKEEKKTRLPQSGIEYGKTSCFRGENREHPAGKNPGDVWIINTQPYPKAHYATFPEKLVEKCLLAGCPKEICKKCGMVRKRITKKGKLKAGRKQDKQYAQKKLGKDLRNQREKGWNYEGQYAPGLFREHHTIGWTDCGCGEGWRPGVALDPFAGSGTVGKVAIELGLDVILVDAKREYIEKHCKERLNKVQPNSQIKMEVL